MAFPQMQPVASSWIAAVGRDGEDTYITFRNGKTFKYEGVPADEHDALVDAGSVGEHFHAHIKGRYTGVLV